MKHLLWIAILYVACNNTASTNQTSDPIKTTVSEEKEEAGPVACNKLIFFQPGAAIYAKSYDAKGKVIASQLTKVLNVKNEGGMSVAYVESSDTARIGKSTNNRKYNYKCDGKKIYLDIAAMFRNTAAEERDATFEASLMEYPIALSAGQTLPEATGTMQVTKRGQKMTMKYHYKDRKVEGRETVTTPAGSWSCYKVINRVEMEIDIPGMDANAKRMMESMTNKRKTTGITWFSPEFGVVKMEMYQNGKLQLKHEIVAVKR